MSAYEVIGVEKETTNAQCEKRRDHNRRKINLNLFDSNISLDPLPTSLSQHPMDIIIETVLFRSFEDPARQTCGKTF